MFESVELLGFFATILSSIATMPQAYRILKTKDADAVSTETYILLTTSYIAWLLYAYHTAALSLFIASFTMLVTAILILGLKLNIWVERNYPNQFHLYSGA